MRFLVDAVLPATLGTEAPAGVEFYRWNGTDDGDEQVVRFGAAKGCRGVIFFDRNSLSQPGLIGLSELLGIALIAVDATDPIEAKERILQHTTQLRRILNETQLVLILGSGVRSFEPPSVDPALHAE